MVKVHPNVGIKARPSGWRRAVFKSVTNYFTGAMPSLAALATRNFTVVFAFDLDRLAGLRIAADSSRTLSFD